MSSACVCHIEGEWCFYCEMYTPLEKAHAAAKEEIARLNATYYADHQRFIDQRRELAETQTREQKLKVARSIEEWHEDYGVALWWTFPIEEPPYCGSPLNSEWPGYHTHWTPIVEPEAVLENINLPGEVTTL